MEVLVHVLGSAIVSKPKIRTFSDMTIHSMTSFIEQASQSSRQSSSPTSTNLLSHPESSLPSHKTHSPSSFNPLPGPLRLLHPRLQLYNLPPHPLHLRLRVGNLRLDLRYPALYEFDAGVHAHGRVRFVLFQQDGADEFVDLVLWGERG